MQQNSSCPSKVTEEPLLGPSREFAGVFSNVSHFTEQCEGSSDVHEDQFKWLQYSKARTKQLLKQLAFKLLRPLTVQQQTFNRNATWAVKCSAEATELLAQRVVTLQERVQHLEREIESLKQLARKPGQ